MKRTSMSLAAGLLLMATGARAQIKPGMQQAGLSLGGAKPLSSDTVDGERFTFGESGPALGLNYLYQVHQYVSVGADLNIKSLGDKDVFTGRGPASIKSSAWTLLAVARGDLLPDENVRPYALLGLGVGGVKRQVRYSQSPRFDSDHRSSGLAFALAGGADFDITPSWLAGAELRYNFIGTDENQIGADSVKTLDLMFKVGYKF